MYVYIYIYVVLTVLVLKEMTIKPACRFHCYTVRLMHICTMTHPNNQLSSYLLIYSE